MLYITRCSVLSKERTFNQYQKPQCRVKASRVWRNKLKVQQKMLVRKIKYCSIFGGGLSCYFHSKISCSCIGANRTQLPLFSPLCKFWPSPGEDHRLAMALKAASTHPLLPLCLLSSVQRLSLSKTLNLMFLEQWSLFLVIITFCI